MSSQVPEWPWLRQTPGSRGVWGQCQFFTDPDREECDYWVVYEGLNRRETACCPPDNTILITGEPPSIKKYQKQFMNQFETVITCQQTMKHPNVIHSQTGLPWWVGMKLIKTPGGLHKWRGECLLDYDKLKSMGPPPKDKLVSVLTSEKTMTPGHVRRLKFARWLEKEFGSEIDVFIYSINGPEDKWDVIAPYRYHIALENCAYPDYFTEKLVDSFLGLSYPIYYGCTNLEQYFPRTSFSRIDINNFEEARRIIENVLSQRTYERCFPSLVDSKNLVLDKYNLFALLAEHCRTHPSMSSPSRITLNPEEPSRSRIKGYFSWRAGRLKGRLGT